MLQLNIENQPQPQFNHKEKFVNNLFGNEVENVLTDLKTDLSIYSLYQNLVLKDNMFASFCKIGLFFLGSVGILMCLSSPMLILFMILFTSFNVIKLAIEADRKQYLAKLENINEIKPKYMFSLRNRKLWEKLEDKKDSIIKNLKKLENLGVFDEEIILKIVDNEKMSDFYKNMKIIKKEHEIIDSYVKPNELILSFEDFKKRENIKNNNLGNKSFENLKTSVDELYYVFKNIQLSLIKK